MPNATEILAMHYPSNPKFQPFQLLTHMFAHGGILHILFNMYAIFNFGTILERIMPPQRFIMLYFVSGFGAITFHLLVSAIMAYNAAGTIFITQDIAVQNQTLANIYFPSLVGASGALYGLLAAFGILFPNAPLMFMFIPFPIKAKYMIPLIIILYDIAFAQYGLDNVAHYAHIGGAVFGALLTLYWRKTNKKDFY
jgi:rhomboid-like protein